MRTKREHLMLILCEGIVSEYKKIYPNNSGYLHISLSDGYLNINNAYWDDDKEDQLKLTKEIGEENACN